MPSPVHVEHWGRSAMSKVFVHQRLQLLKLFEVCLHFLGDGRPFLQRFEQVWGQQIKG